MNMWFQYLCQKQRREIIGVGYNTDSKDHNKTLGVNVISDTKVCQTVYSYKWLKVQKSKELYQRLSIGCLP